MKFLILLLLVATATCLPKQKTKTFPKKFDSTIHGVKDTYSTYSGAPDNDLSVPAEFPSLDSLQAPSSYAGHFERQPQDPILPPEVPSYDVVPSAFIGDALSPPAVDTYSSPEGVPHRDMVPPPVDAIIPSDALSYVTYDSEGSLGLVPPPLSTYAHIPDDQAGADVLASLASMLHLLPPQVPSTYESYDPSATISSLPSDLVPPNVEDAPAPSSSSYSELPEEQPELTEEQILRAQEADVSVPSRFLEPPSFA